MLYQYFRVAIFVAHAVTALFFLVAAFNTSCAEIVNPTYRSMSSFLPAAPNQFAVVLRPPPTPCPDLVPETSLGFPAASRASAWCMAAQTPPLIESAESIQSFVIGSSWNVLILILMFEWITTSYALLYLEEPVVLWSNVPTPPGVHPVPFIATLWNLTLLILMWFYRRTLLLPDNNLFLFSFLLGATIIFQNYIARPISSNAPPPSTPLSTNSAIVDTRLSVSDAMVWRTDHFLRQRTTPGNHPKNASTKYVSLDAAVVPEVPLHQPDYAVNLDLKGEAVAARMMEYSCSAPLLIVGLYLNFTTTALTWTYQSLFASLCVCNGLGVPLHYAMLMLKTASPTDRPKLQAAGWLLLAASWLAFAAGFAIYLFTASFVLTNADAGAPSWVVGLLWIVLVFYTLFGVVVTYYYVPCLINPDGATKGNDAWPSTFDAVVFWLDIFSFVIKLTVAWTVYSKGSVVNCLDATCI